MNIPGQIVIGDSITWDDTSFRDNLGNSIQSGSYTLTYSLRGAFPVIDLAAVANGTGWQTTLTIAQSATLTAGNVFWAAYASATGQRITAGQGVVQALTNLQAVSVNTFDGRMQSEIDLDAVSAEIRNRITGNASLKYTIGNRTLEKEPIAALMKLQADLRRQVAADRAKQQIANGLGNPRVSYVRFR